MQKLFEQDMKIALNSLLVALWLGPSILLLCSNKPLNHWPFQK